MSKTIEVKTKCPHCGEELKFEVEVPEPEPAPVVNSTPEEKPEGK